MLAEGGKNNVFQDTCSWTAQGWPSARLTHVKTMVQEGFTREVILLNVVHVDAPIPNSTSALRFQEDEEAYLDAAGKYLADVKAASAQKASSEDRGRGARPAGTGHHRLCLKKRPLDLIVIATTVIQD